MPLNNGQPQKQYTVPEQMVIQRLTARIADQEFESASLQALVTVLQSEINARDEQIAGLQETVRQLDVQISRAGAGELTEGDDDEVNHGAAV